MSKPEYTITFACHNSIKYTKTLIDCILASNVDLKRVAIVDNLSTDGTQDYLNTLPIGSLILNKRNYGCGTAWNQGVLALQSEWTIIMNNDVIFRPEALDDLIATAQKYHLLVASPAMIEGPLDYDESILGDYARIMRHYVRQHHLHGVCVAVHRDVWESAGFFRATPSLLGYEDTIFFRNVKRLGIPHGTVGASWIHHFGSITQKAMKRSLGAPDHYSLGDRFHPELGRESFVLRKYRKFAQKIQNKVWLTNELSDFRISVHGLRSDSEVRWL